MQKVRNGALRRLEIQCQYQHDACSIWGDPLNIWKIIGYLDKHHISEREKKPAVELQAETKHCSFVFSTGVELAYLRLDSYLELY